MRTTQNKKFDLPAFAPKLLLPTITPIPPKYTKVLVSERKSRFTDGQYTLISSWNYFGINLFQFQLWTGMCQPHRKTRPHFPSEKTKKIYICEPIWALLDRF